MSTYITSLEVIYSDHFNRDEGIFLKWSFNLDSASSIGYAYQSNIY